MNKGLELPGSCKKPGSSIYQCSIIVTEDLTHKVCLNMLM